MALKTVYDANGNPRKMGRKKSDPAKLAKVLPLKKYITDKLPAPPAGTNNAAAATEALSQMYENDQLGDCVIAGCGHVEGVITANAGDQLIYTNDQIITEYEVCGYDPSQGPPGNNPTDQGCEIVDVLQYWQQSGFPAGSRQIVGYLSIDATNQTEVMQATWLFQNVIIGLDLPDAWINPFPNASGFVWDLAGQPDPDNGHCPPIIDYNADGAIVSTWGLTGTMTWEAVNYYCAAAQGGEAYVVLTQDILNQASQLSPTGLSWAQLEADFEELGGTTSTAA
jgi:hypothetical protein